MDNVLFPWKPYNGIQVEILRGRWYSCIMSLKFCVPVLTDRDGWWQDARRMQWWQSSENRDCMFPPDDISLQLLEGGRSPRHLDHAYPGTVHSICPSAVPGFLASWTSSLRRLLASLGCSIWSHIPSDNPSISLSLLLFSLSPALNLLWILWTAFSTSSFIYRMINIIVASHRQILISGLQ